MVVPARSERRRHPPEPRRLRPLSRPARRRRPARRNRGTTARAAPAQLSLRRAAPVARSTAERGTLRPGRTGAHSQRNLPSRIVAPWRQLRGNASLSAGYPTFPGLQAVGNPVVGEERLFVGAKRTLAESSSMSPADPKQTSCTSARRLLLVASPLRDIGREERDADKGSG